MEGKCLPSMLEDHKSEGLYISVIMLQVICITSGMLKSTEALGPTLAHFIIVMYTYDCGNYYNVYLMLCFWE